MSPVVRYDGRMPLDYFLAIGLAILAPFVVGGLIKLALVIAGRKHRRRDRPGDHRPG